MKYFRSESVDIEAVSRVMENLKENSLNGGRTLSRLMCRRIREKSSKQSYKDT